MEKSIFITGTDTGIGKTFYTCQLLRALDEQGYRCAAMKPVASGAENSGEGLKNEDALMLQSAMNVELPYTTVNPYCFAEAIAPHIAAQHVQQIIDFALIKKEFEIIRQRADVTLVEGVGGWRVPLNEHHTLDDLVLYLDIPVVLVVGIRLGCINHALLSASAIQQSGARLIGWIANVIDMAMPVRDENIQAIEQRLDFPLLDTLQCNQDKNLSLPIRTDWVFAE